MRGFRAAHRIRSEPVCTENSDSHVSVSGNGISGPEKNTQKRPADCNDAVSENEPSHRSPPIRGLSYTFRKSPVAHDCVVVDAVRIEPVSSLQFRKGRVILASLQGGAKPHLAKSH